MTKASISFLCFDATHPTDLEKICVHMNVEEVFILCIAMVSGRKQPIRSQDRGHVTNQKPGQRPGDQSEASHNYQLVQCQGVTAG